MSQDTPLPRRTSNGANTIPATIPRAPPLPAQRPLQRARDAASRFLGYQPRAQSAYGDRDDDRFVRGSSLFKRFAPLSPSQNATVSHKTGLEINTIAINESGTHALIGGKEVFKTIKVHGGECREDFNLRDAIRSRPTEADGKPRRSAPTIDIADVAWAKGSSGDYVASATNSGKIILYNLNQEGIQTAQLHEHERQVHRVTFNPHGSSLLLSGSQDGTVRLWDLKDLQRNVAIVSSRRKFAGQNSPVRDVKWSPTDSVDFACGTDAGEIQRWDMRNLKAPKSKVLAHSLACNAVDWHPDGKHLIGAGSDKTVRVFDLSLPRPKRAAWEIRTAYPVMNARWRPSCESWMPNDHGARLCTQIVTSYDRQHPVVHIWDFRRPTLPFREVEPYQSAPTDLLWHTQDLLWTVGREGIFLQTDVQHMPKVIAKRNLQALAISPLSEMTTAVQRRHQYRTQPPALQQTQPKQNGSLGTSPDHSQLSRSWADDTLDHSFLSAMSTRRHSRTGSGGRNAIMSSPASNPHGQPPVLKLDDVLLNRKSFRPHQVACRGYFYNHNSFEPTSRLADCTWLKLAESASDEQFIDKIQDAFEHNRQQALAIGYANLGFWWRLSGFTVITHLKARLAHKDQRMSDKLRPLSSGNPSRSIRGLAARLAGRHTHSPTQTSTSVRPLSTIAQQHLAGLETGSTVPTPLARPASGNRTVLPSGHSVLPDPDKDEALALPPSLTPSLPIPVTVRPEEDPSSPTRRLTVENLTDLERSHSHQDADRSNMVRRWSSRRQVPFKMDVFGSNGTNIRAPHLEKHDSNESFQFLEESTGSRAASFPASFASAESSSQRMVAERPSRKFGQHSDEQVSNLKEEIFGETHDTTHPTRQQMPSEELGNLADRKRTPNGDVPPTQVPQSSHQDTETGLDEQEQVVLATPEKAQHRPTGQTFSNFCPEETGVDLEQDQAWTCLEILQEVVRHYTEDQPYPQACAMFLALLGPLLPRTHALPHDETEATIAHYVDYFLSHLDWSPDDIPILIEHSFEHPLGAGLQPLQVESILSLYHEQLFSMRLFDKAAALRELAYPAYPAVYEDFLQDNHIYLKCGSCGKAIVSGMEGLRCESCKEKQRSCEFCWSDVSPFLAGGNVKTTLYSACLACGHVGHAACFHEWYVNKKGSGCLTMGCLCPCVIRT